MCALVHLSMGTPGGPDDIKPLVQVYPCMSQHSFCHTLDCFDYPHKKGYNVIHRCSIYIFPHINPQLEIQGHGIMGTKRLAHLIQFIWQGMSDVEVSAHCYCSVRMHLHVAK
jgi:hypothetical protein